MSRFPCFPLLAFPFVFSLTVLGQVTETGRIGVYPDAAEGRMTSSGALYSRTALTAAHATLPMGTKIRVANFETGRMVDLVINDRKAQDGLLVVVSSAAANQIGIRGGGQADGAVHLQSSGPVTNAPATSAKKPGPFAAVFGKPSSGGSAVQYGIPADRYAPPVQKRGGGLFSKNSKPSPVPAGPGSGPRPELQPLNAMGPTGAIPAGAVPRTMIPAPSVAAGAVALPPACPAAPYRVQFGAFKRQGSADELSAMLDRAGIPSSVFLDQERGLNVVVTDGGFANASEAARWIDYEGGRRGWTERPVVIR